DGVAERLQQLPHLSHRSDAVRVDVRRSSRRIEEDPDPEVAGVGAGLLQEGTRGGRCEVGFAGHGPGDAVEDRRRVPDGPGHDVVAYQARLDVAELRAQRDPSSRGLEAEQPTLAGGDADRAATVV